MNKLELARRVQREINSHAVGDQIETTILDGLAPVQHWQVVSWLEDEYRALWTEQLWSWQQENGTLITTAESGGAVLYDYAPADAEGRVIERFIPTTLLIRRPADTVWQPLCWCDYATWQDVYDQLYDSLSPSLPQIVTQLPNKQLRLTPKPDIAGYIIRGEYYKPFAELVEDGDEPPWAPELHDVLIWRTARNFLEELNSPPLTLRVMKKLAEREQTFINRYVG